MLWLLCIVAAKLPDIVPVEFQKFAIKKFSAIGNPFTKSIKNEDVTNEQKCLASIISMYLEYALKNWQITAEASVLVLLEDYVALFKGDQPMQILDDQSDLRHYYVSYILSLIHISPQFTNAIWAKVFGLLYNDKCMGSIFLFEKEYNFSLHRDVLNANYVYMVDIFPLWLSQVAFNPSGLVMKHALDVAVMLDTIAHDERLDMKALIPNQENSIVTAMQASFTVPDLEPASVDLIDWTITLLKDNMNRANEVDMQIPMFLLQLRGLQSKVSAEELLSHLLFRLDRSSDADSNASKRYLIFHLISRFDEKEVLNKIFSKLESVISKLTDERNPDALIIGRVLGSCSVIAEPCQDDVLFHISKATLTSLQTYLAAEWKTVMSLFINHPSMICRTSGYEVLRYSRFWERTKEPNCVQEIVEKMTQTWFRQLSERFSAVHMRGEKYSALKIAFIDLFLEMSQDTNIAKHFMEYFADRIFDGALESVQQSRYYTFTPSENWALLETYRKQPSLLMGSACSPDKQMNRRRAGSKFKPRQARYFSQISKGDVERSYQDEVYTQNIDDTTALLERMAQQQHGIGHQIATRISAKWPSVVTPIEKYDQMLPQALPTDRDGHIGNAFRDHPGLFGLLRSCYHDGQVGIYDLLRSLLAYYVAFWHMGVVEQAETPLEHCVQLEGTIQLIELLGQTGAIETQLSNCSHLLASLDIRDIGNVVYSAIWEYTRQCPVGTEIPGLGTVTKPSSDMRAKNTTIAVAKIKSIVGQRINSLSAMDIRADPKFEETAKKYHYL
ncbi:hypothetical protein NQZ79_g8145 [Umbelopsis isabellina]|nr:hypothetical protein NQZ79_g8145 [Umbelopsis isabellina]